MAKKKKTNNVIWILQITVIAFFISFGLSFLSDRILSNVGVVAGSVILVLFILFGVLFDMIGVAITCADIGPFNSMSSRKVKAADVAVMLIKNAEKVSSFCNDVVGDICGIISGSAAVVVAVLIANALNAELLIVTLSVTAISASLTIGGKAIGKSIALKNATPILYAFAKIIGIVYKPKK